MPDNNAAPQVLSPQPLSLNLVMDETLRSSLNADLAVDAMLNDYIIDSPEMAAIANNDMRASIERIAEIKKAKAGFVAPAKTIIAHAEAFFDPSIAARERFVAGMRGKLTTWTQEQQRIAEEARRQREAEEREARQRADREAATARARAQEEAAALQRQADEAERNRQAAIAEGNAKAAAKAAAQAASLSEKAVAAVENGEAKAAQAESAALATATATPAPAPAKVAGFGLRDNWQLELAPGTPDEASAIAKIVAGITGVTVEKFVRPDLLAQLKRDESAGHRTAKALKKATNVPGMQAVNRQTSVSRAA